MRFLENCSRKNKNKRSATKSKHKPSFFKILLLDFTRVLGLPPAFIKKNYGSNLPRRVKLRISDQTWKVKVEMEDNLHCFTHGWNKFVKDVGLEMGELLVFRMTAKAVFRVSIFETTGCKREFPGNQFPSCDSDDDESDDEMKCKKYMNSRRKRSRPGNDSMSESEDQESPEPCYSFTLKEYQKLRLTLQRKFVRASGIQRLPQIRLEYLPGGFRHYIAFVTYRGQHIVQLSGGWAAFREAYLTLGETYSLRFIRNKNVIQIKEEEMDD